MNKSFVIALALIIALIKGSRGDNKPNYKPRKNEAECSSRRCCSIRDELTPSDLPIGLNCNTLSDYECGQQDSYCEWDCDEAMRNNKNIKRKYRGISSRDGSYQEAALPKHDNKEYDNKQLLQKCLSEGGKFLSIDDCGVEYEEEIKDFDVICHQLYGNKDAPKDKNDEHRRLWVIGSDGRSQVNNMDVFPYDTVLFLEYNDRNNGQSTSWNGCTATMISQDMAITAAHCVWGRNNWVANDWKFLWSIDDCNEKERQLNAGNYYVWTSVHVYSAYTQPGGDIVENDMALLKFDTKGRTHNWLGFGHEFNSAQAFNSIGYPNDKGDGCTPFEQTCKYQEFYTNAIVSTECDHWHGQSGSAIWQYDNNNQATIYAILSRGSPDGAPLKNYDCRITADKVRWICSFTNTCN